MATNRKVGDRGRDVSPKILGAFIKALYKLEKEGKPLDLLLKKAIEEDGILAVLPAIARFSPKILDISSEETVNVQINTNQLSNEIMESLITEQHPDLSKATTH
jgi:hypothetical protein